MTTLKTSKDRRTTAENPAFVAYVALCLANEMREQGNPAYRIAEAFGAQAALKHGKMPGGIFIPESDFTEVRAGLIEALKNHAAEVPLARMADGAKH